MALPIDIPEEEARERLRQVVEASHMIRATHLGLARTLESAKSRRLEVEGNRLEAKHGEGTPRAEEARARAAAVEGLQGLLSAEVERARIRPPQADGGAFVAHGRVVDADGRGLSGVTVVALDESDEEVARRRTGREGRFELRIRKPKPQEERPPERGPSPRGRAKPAPEQTAPREIHLMVLKGDEEIARDSASLSLKTGTVMYREVAVGPAGKPRRRRPAARRKRSAPRRTAGS